MSGPKSSYYTLTERQRQILEEQLKKELERAKAEATLKNRLATINNPETSIVFDAALSEECQSQLDTDYGYSKKRAEIFKTIQQTKKAIKKADTQSVESIKSAIEVANQSISDIHRLSDELKQLDEQCRESLRKEYTKAMDAAFQTSFADEKTFSKDQKSNDEIDSIIQNLLEMKSNPILPEKLITEISVIISEFETITDPHYKKNYRSVKVIPLIRKCRDYLTFYHNNHNDFLEMQEEYLALCNLYGYHAIDIPFSIEGYSKLHDEIERIKTQSKKSAEQAYIQQALDEVMTEMGYSVLGSREVTKRSGKHFRNELYTFGEGTAVNVTYSSDGRIAMELGGLDTSDRMPTEGECTALCAEMEEFCTDFKEIEKRLLSKGVILANRVSLLPPNAEYATIINTSDYEMQAQPECFSAEQRRKTATGKKSMRAE